MNFFKELAEKYGSQKKAADAIGVKYQTFSDWATEKKAPSVLKAKALKEKLGVSLDDIYR